MLTIAEERGDLARKPKLKLRKEEGRQRHLTAEMEAQLAPYLSENVRDVIAIVRDTGLRTHSECCAMKWENIDLDAALYYNPRTKSEKAERKVALGQRVMAILSRRRMSQGFPKKGWVFPSDSKEGRLTSINNVFRHARQKAGLPDSVVPYCGRHNFGTRMMEETGDPKLVGALMGHATVTTTMKYNHPELDRVREIIDREQKVTAPKPPTSTIPTTDAEPASTLIN